MRFHGGAPIIEGGQRQGSKPIQPDRDQNAGQHPDPLGQLTGFGIQLASSDYTASFVIAGTFNRDELVYAVPMLDLATGDQPPRPVDPVSGNEIAPQVARSLTDAIAQPTSALAGQGATTEHRPLEEPGILVQQPTLTAGNIACLIGMFVLGGAIVAARFSMRRRPA